MKRWMMVTTGKTGRRMIFSSLKKELRSMPTGESEVIKHPSQPDHRTKSEHLKMNSRIYLSYVTRKGLVSAHVLSRKPGKQILFKITVEF